MNKYELLFIISATTPDDQKEAIISKVTSFIEKNVGTVDAVDKWGMKKFAYPINFKNEGYYVLVNFTIAPSKIAELDNMMYVNENIVRQMFVKKEN